MVSVPLRDAIEQARATGRVQPAELYPNPTDGAPVLDIVGPLTGPDETVRAMMVLRLELETSLFRRLREWPLPTITGQSMLVRRGNDSVCYVSPLRGDQYAPFQLRVPLTRDEVVAVRAASGNTGTVWGENHRGESVLADVRPVPGTPWHLVTELPTSEAFGELRYRAQVAAVGVVLLILLSATIVGWSGNRRARRNYEKLFEAERRAMLTQFATDQAQIAICRIVPNGEIAYANNYAAHLCGYSTDELTQMKIWELDAGVTEKGWPAFRESLKNAQEPNFESTFQRRDGSEFPVEITMSFLHFQGEEHAFAYIRDVTDRKEAEAELQRRVAEKELLIREVHHRVKNNLTVISSLLNLQARQLEHAPEAAAGIQESRDRIQAMTLVHKMLYQTDDFTSISMRSYVESLVRDLVRLHNASERVALNLAVSDISLDVNRAIPCGIIINELVTNVFKHAMPANDNVSLSVGLEEVSEGWALLTVADGGPGLPEGFDAKKSSSLGMQLVDVLANQLRSKLEVESSSAGTKFAVRFPLQ